jgi:hypothetical protein
VGEQPIPYSLPLFSSPAPTITVPLPQLDGQQAMHERLDAVRDTSSSAPHPFLPPSLPPSLLPLFPPTHLDGQQVMHERLDAVQGHQQLHHKLVRVRARIIVCLA